MVELKGLIRSRYPCVIRSAAPKCDYFVLSNTDSYLNKSVINGTAVLELVDSARCTSRKHVIYIEGLLRKRIFVVLQITSY